MSSPWQSRPMASKHQAVRSGPQNDPSCPLCGGMSSFAFEKHNIRICDCLDCRHRFADYTPLPSHVADVYGDDYFLGGGAGYPDYFAEADLIRKRGQRYGRLLKKYLPPARVLDIGAAAGYFMQGLADEGWEVEGLEPNATMARITRERLSFPVRNIALESLDEDASFDVISLVQVLPHFQDLSKALSNARRATRPGGYWLIETWNRASLTARLLGRHWHEYSPPSVLHWFNPDDISNTARIMGFSILATGRPRREISVDHARALLTYKATGSRLASLIVRISGTIPGKWTLPYPSEDLMWVLLKKEGE